MSKLNILFIGCGEAQLKAIESALELGLGVYAFDGNPKAKGFEYCDAYECCNIKDLNQVESNALKFNKKYGINGCMAPGVEVGPSVGRVIDKLMLPGIPELTAEMLTNKLLRCSMFEKYKINQPKTYYNNDPDTFPCVIKPKNDAGARGVLYIENKEQLKGKSFDIWQEYLEGWEVSTEVLVFPDQTFMFVNSDRNYDKKMKYKPHLLEDGCQLPSKLPPTITEKIRHTITKLVQSFNLKACAIKLDLLIKDNQVYVIECAPRLGGGKLSSHMIPMSFGINWWGITVCLSMGLPIPQNYMPSKDFKITNVAQRYQFPDNPKSHHDRITDFIETGETIEEAITKAEVKVTNAQYRI